ncbi:S8 family serine peptidase [Scytonema sp. NUACC26]|uniref:S8 family serine peptidase n=1 Tax=Scytonema sp. NUACC26 TaxID=3140176 RepID=UPI0038B2D23F
MTLSQDSLETACNFNALTYSSVNKNSTDILGNSLYPKKLYNRSSLTTDFCNLSDSVYVEPSGYEINEEAIGEAPNGLSRIAVSRPRSASPDPINVINNTYGTALSIPINSYTNNYSDWVNRSETDYYQFNLETTTVMSLKLYDLSGNADLELRDISGFTLASSKNAGVVDEAIVQRLSPGTYYIQISADTNSSTTYYNLSVSAAPVNKNTLPVPTTGSTPSNAGASSNPPTAASVTSQTLSDGVTFQLLSDGTRYYKGNLGANTFTYTDDPTSKITVFSGNGNAYFGSGQRDLLYLSSIVSSKLEDASTSGKGVLYNVGNCTRLFDAIKLDDGRQILFEGINRIIFADKQVNLSVEPNDPLFNQQWNLHMMGVQDAWRFTTGNSNVLVGVQDTGLALVNGNTHPDLGPTTYSADNYADEMSGANATSHGLSTQSIINARTNNGQGGSGILWNGEVYAGDVIGGDANDWSLVDATSKMITKANAENRRLVINFSLTGGYSLQLEQLVASNPNVLYVFASGNTGADTLAEPAIYLAKYPNVMVTGASWGPKDYYGNLKTLGERITYLNWWGSNSGQDLTLSAPGEVIAANASQSNASSGLQFGYNYNFNGTSAAAPHVTGVAALLWSVNKNLSASDIKTILSQNAYDLGTPGYDRYYGNGFVNADAAVRRALAIARGA